MEQNDSSNSVDLNVLVDIMSNIAGVMILLACLAVLIHFDSEDGQQQRELQTKPIQFPMAYLPTKKPISICLKGDQLYRLPIEELYTQISDEIQEGRTVEFLELEEGGVFAKAEKVPTHTGFRMNYRLTAGAGRPLEDAVTVRQDLDRLLSQYPPGEFFYNFIVWPESFAEFSDIREYIFEKGGEVGWSPRLHETDPVRAKSPDFYDVSHSFGEYSEHLSSFKAQ